MKLSKAGKPLCCRCRKLATNSYEYGVTKNDVRKKQFIYYCKEHAPFDSQKGILTTSEQLPDVHELLSLVKDYYAAALLGEKLTDPTYEEEREFQARMIGLIDRTEKLLDVDTGDRESGDERIEQHGREWATSLAEQRANASMWGY